MVCKGVVSLPGLQISHAHLSYEACHGAHACAVKVWEAPEMDHGLGCQDGSYGPVNMAMSDHFNRRKMMPNHRIGPGIPFFSWDKHGLSLGPSKRHRTFLERLALPGWIQEVRFSLQWSTKKLTCAAHTESPASHFSSSHCLCTTRMQCTLGVSLKDLKAEAKKTHSEAKCHAASSSA